ncbi:MAG TPA: ABC transporter ATP-binding protein [Acidimicrobiales bacterium]|jgi:ABC-2 type transport system ATP-binding protein|nr:ABC transporter ATP-binding protein [Acidimicrobiales bacterium]
MTPTISVTQLGRTYKDHAALADVTLDIAPNAITGLLGRNGAGKSTLMRIIAAQEFASSGTVRVLGEDPMENDRILRRITFVREDQIFPDFKVRHVIRAASWFHPNWSEELAQTLLADFELPPNRPMKKLSRGMRSAVGIVIGLAARAEVTLLDEPYAGLDAVARQIFYDRLLADYVEHPRTVLLSTHLIDEVADLLEHVVMIDHGRILIDAPADTVRGQAATIGGPADAVERFVAGRPILHRRTMASVSSVVVGGGLLDQDYRQARDLHLTVQPLSLQELIVHTSETTTEARKSA